MIGMIGSVFIPPIGLVTEAWNLVHTELQPRFPDFTTEQIDTMVDDLFRLYGEFKFNSINHTSE